MRFTQLGHQVPRKNSTITGPRCSNDCRSVGSCRFAALSVNFGAGSPTLRVSVVLLSLMRRYANPIRMQKQQQLPTQTNADKRIGQKKEPWHSRPRLCLPSCNTGEDACATKALRFLGTSSYRSGLENPWSIGQLDHRHLLSLRRAQFETRSIQLHDHNICRGQRRDESDWQSRSRFHSKRQSRFFLAVIERSPSTNLQINLGKTGKIATYYCPCSCDICRGPLLNRDQALERADRSAQIEMNTISIKFPRVVRKKPMQSHCSSETSKYV